jgi:hypothetical protein
MAGRDESIFEIWRIAVMSAVVAPLVIQFAKLGRKPVARGPASTSAMACKSVDLPELLRPATTVQPAYDPSGRAKSRSTDRPPWNPLTPDTCSLAMYIAVTASALPNPRLLLYLRLAAPAAVTRRYVPYNYCYRPDPAFALRKISECSSRRAKVRHLYPQDCVK